MGRSLPSPLASNRRATASRRGRGRSFSFSFHLHRDADRAEERLDRRAVRLGRTTVPSQWVRRAAIRMRRVITSVWSVPRPRTASPARTPRRTRRRGAAAATVTMTAYSSFGSVSRARHVTIATHLADEARRVRHDAHDARARRQLRLDRADRDAGGDRDDERLRDLSRGTVWRVRSGRLTQHDGQ